MFHTLALCWLFCCLHCVSPSNPQILIADTSLVEVRHLGQDMGQPGASLVYIHNQVWLAQSTLPDAEISPVDKALCVGVILWACWQRSTWYHKARITKPAQTMVPLGCHTPIPLPKCDKVPTCFTQSLGRWGQVSIWMALIYCTVMFLNSTPPPLKNLEEYIPEVEK